MPPRKTACPRCREAGGDTAGDNLQVYIDGGYCHACGYTLTKKQLDQYLGAPSMTEPRRQRSEQDIAAELELIKTYPFGAPHKPDLPANLVQRAGIRYSVDDQGTPDAVYYPYYEGGHITDFKVRRLPKTFYCTSGKVNRAELFGQHLVQEGRRGLLVLVEGEDDKVAAEAMFAQTGMMYTVLSLQNGANEEGKLDSAVKRQFEFINSFKKVALCLDQDKPGKATTKALAEVLAPTQEVRLIKLPEGYKDAYDMYTAGQAHAFREALNNAERYTPEGIIEGPSITLAELQAPMQPGYALPFPMLEKKLHGLRKAEITLVTAGTGIGKTTWLRETGYHLITHHGLTIGSIYLEEQWQKTVNGYIAIDNNVPLPLLRIRPNIITQQQWQASYDKLLASGKTHYFKHFGSVASEHLIAKMRYMAIALGCDFIFLDHVTMVMSGNDTLNERKDIDILMTRLAELVNETGVGVIPVVHLKRSDGKDFNHGEEVGLTDLRGSSQLEALSWNVIALERDQQGTQPDVSKLRLLKNREWGSLGVCDRMVYNPQTGRMTAIATGL